MKTILGLLALTFVVFFGTSDFGGGHGGGQGGRNTNSVVEVDNVDFSLRQVGREFNAQIQQISRAAGQQIDLQGPLAPRVLDQAIDTLVTRSLYDLAARDLGVTASDAAVEEAIRRIDAFRNDTGGFDRTLFGAYLRQAGLSEQQFIESARGDLQRSQYLGTLSAGIAVPDPMLDAVYRYRAERRVAELVTISATTVEGLTPPDETQLAAFYEENKRLFQAPEYRGATVAGLSVEQLAQAIEVDDEEVAEVYADRLDAFTRDERREILQAIFLEKESAEKAAAMIAEGRPFSEVVEEVGGFPPVEMGAVDRTQISEPELADAAFAADAGAVVGPVETSLGWQLMSIVSVEPEETIPLSEVADNLRRAIALDHARDDIFDVLAAVEDGLAAGGSLEEVARENGIELQQLEPFSPAGVIRSGETVSIEPLAEVVNAVYSTPEGEIGDVVETRAGGFFVVRTDSITPPQIEPLEQVRDRVTTAWLDNERLRLAVERAETLAEKARDGGNLEQLAAEIGAKFEVTPAFDRTGQGSTIAGPLIAPIFEAGEGDVVEAQIENGAGVARVVEIQKADTADEFAREDVRAQLADGFNRDLAQQLTAALRDRYTIDVDRETIEQSLLPQ